MESKTSESSVLIIGAGIFGASTAYHLSLKYGDTSKITVIDRTTFPPEPAASTDINKIIRADYSSPFYCDLAYEALKAWAEWPELKDFYHRTGWIMLDEEVSDLSERIRKVFRDRGHDPTMDVPLDQLENHWKGILKGTDTKGFRDAYWNPEAGWCNAAAATAALMAAAVDRGVTYVSGDVAGLKLGSSGIARVRTTDGRHFSSEQVVLATGAWTSSILSPLEDELDIPEKDRVEQQASAAGVCVAHYKMSTEEMTKLSEMPVVVYGENGEVIPPPKENSLLKYTNAHTFKNTIVTKSGHSFSVPPNRDQHIVSKRLQRETEQTMVTKVMPKFPRGKQAAYWRLCWDARTPTQDWLLSKHTHPKLSNLYLAVGGSFHSYKFLPTAGKYMVNVLSGAGNGEEKNRAWGWKSGRSGGRGAHEKTEPKRELRDVEDDVPESKL
jgi:sarcosine oxidase / L-pipecolate oxidase